MTETEERLQPPTLFNAQNVAIELGVSRTWVLSHLRRTGRGVPRPEFRVYDRGGKATPLWSSRGMDAWRAYHASTVSTPDVKRYPNFSDHRAVNKIGYVTATWKLWWHSAYDGNTVWWFSTPEGWFTSTNDGRTWEPTGEMERPGDRRYFAVIGNENAAGSLVSVLRSTATLRKAILAKLSTVVSV